MKIQIDTLGKIIKIEESVNLGELVKVLDKLLPTEWKEYKLETGSIIYWTNPIQIYPYNPYNPYPYPYPYPYPLITYTTDGIGSTIPTSSFQSTYNIEVN